ncbi:MAG TPA: MFS transporter [Gaiellales bacterium]|nr:MFS transporter [Gaiellales bacterium]
MRVELPARRLIPELLAQNAAFRGFWLAQSVSLVGDSVSTLALPLVAVLTLHAGPAEMGYLVAAELVPSLLFSLHAGVWADRRGDRRGLMIATDVGRAALLATIPVAAVLGLLSMTQMYVVAFLVGSLTVLFWVSYNALFVVLVPREQFITGSSLLNGSRAVSFMAGPAIGGLLVQALTAPLAVAADALSFVASALFMRGIDSPEPDPDAGSGGVMAGLRFIARDPIMRASLGATATINLFNFMFFALWILFATKTLHVNAGALGLVIGAGAIGSVIGSVVTAAVQRRVGVGPAFAVGCLLFPAPLMLVPLAGGARPLVLGMLFLAEFFSGMGVMMLDITGGAISAALVPAGLRSRVAGSYMVVNYGVRPIGSLAGGLLGASLGLRPAVWVATVGAVAGVLWLLPSPIMRLRTLPQPAEQPADLR